MEKSILTENSQVVFKEESIFIPFKGTDILHLKRFCGNAQGDVIFMLHGSIENGKIFYSNNGKGLAPFLAKHGYDVFVADLRGKGLSSPPISRTSQYGLTECIHDEIPAFLQEINKIRGTAPQHWMAHSWGGILLLCYYARHAESLRISSMIFLGTKRRITVGGARKFWMITVFYSCIFRIVIWLKGYVNTRWLGIGSENETEKSQKQTYYWINHEDWKDEDGWDYAAALRKIKLPPLLFIAGGNDKVLGHQIDVHKLIEEIDSRQAEFYLAAKSHGNLHDYDHISMLTQSDAPADHFQFIISWLNQHKEE